MAVIRPCAVVTILRVPTAGSVPAFGYSCHWSPCTGGNLPPLTDPFRSAVAVSIPRSLTATAPLF